jgi:peroxiredoxin
MEGVPKRSAFLVDEAGTVRESWRYADSEVPDFDVLLEAVRQFSSSR